MIEGTFIHELALVDETASIGERTRIYQFATVARGARLGQDCTVGPYAKVDGAVFGNRCVIGSGASVPPDVHVASDCFIGPNATICNDAWPRAHKTGFRTGVGPVVIIEDGASIGAGAVVLPGYRVGRGAMVSAGVVVDRNVPPHVILTRSGQLREIASEEGMARRRVRLAR